MKEPWESWTKEEWKQKQAEYEARLATNTTPLKEAEHQLYMAKVSVELEEKSLEVAAKHKNDPKLPEEMSPEEQWLLAERRVKKARKVLVEAMKKRDELRDK